MLKTAFIGNQNDFDIKVCEFLSEHTNLSLIIWTDKLTWANNGPDRKRRVMRRFLKRSQKHGRIQALNEIAYYALYRQFLSRSESRKIRDALRSVKTRPRKPVSAIPQLRPDSIGSEELLREVAGMGLDALFAMCIDVYLPKCIFEAPRLGTFLWHEGITPNYRGVYSPFWALLNEDYENLGYTLLRMNSKLDAGEVFVQGHAEGIDTLRDWHSYIGHKAVLDSFPAVAEFLQVLGTERYSPIDRSDHPDGYYSYPTATALMRIACRRGLRALRPLNKLERTSVK